MSVYLTVQSGPVQMLIGAHEGTAFVELIVEAPRLEGPLQNATPPRRFELKGLEVTAFARLSELARAELKRAGGSKR